MADHTASVDTTPTHPTLSQVLETIEQLWPARLAEPWDASGLVTGRPDQEIRRINWAVDPVQVTVDEAAADGADMLITHHPLFLKPVNFVPATGFKGKVVHTLIENRLALLSAHTNADSVAGGVSDVIAELMGLRELTPLTENPNGTGAEGIGRVGELAEPMTLEELAAKVFDIMPATAGGVRVAGDPEAKVTRIAVCGGAGDSLFDAVRASGAQAYVTADLRHHPASEAREQAIHEGGTPYLIDVSHFASESLWLATGAAQLKAALAERGLSIENKISQLNTDPWDFVLTP